MGHVKHRKYLLWTALFIVGLGIMVLLIRQLDPATVAASFSRLYAGYVIAGAIAYCLCVLTRAWKWYVLARRFDLTMSFMQFAGRYFVYYFFSSLTPLRSGDLFAPLVVGKESDSRQQLYQTLIIDRVIELIVFFFFVVFTVWYLFKNDVLAVSVKLNMEWFVYYGLFAIGLFVILALFVRLSPKVQRMAKTIAAFFAGLQNNLKLLNTQQVFRQFALSAAVWMFDFLYIYFIMRAVGLNELKFVHSVVSQVSSTLFSIVTLVPAGIGTGAVSYVFVAGQLHYTESLLILGAVFAKALYIGLIALIAYTGFLLNRQRNKQS